MFNKKAGFIKRNIYPILFFIIIFTVICISTAFVKNESSKEIQINLEDAITKAIVKCYANEGMYPPSIEYLEDNYGLMINHKNYIVHYEVFAANIFPTVNVIYLK